MRCRVLRSFLVAAALLSARAAGAAQVSGWLGGSGTRYDFWSPDHDTSQRLHLDAGLGASGWVVSPDDIAWNGNVQYGMNRASSQGSRSDEGMLTYSANASAFDSRRSNFALQLGASRAQSDLSQSTGGATLTGTSLSSSLSASARAGGDGLPGLSVSGSWTDSTNSGLDRSDTRRTTKDLLATTGHGGDGYTYQLSYGVRQENGSLPAQDYTSQTLGFNGRAQLTDDTELGIFGQHFTRSPSSSDPLNAKYDDTTLSAASTTRLPAFWIVTRYAFGHFLLESPAAPSTERFNHALSLGATRDLTPDWSITPTLGVSYSQDRIGTAETSAAGQSLGTALRWSPRIPGRPVLVEAGLRAGLLEPAQGDTQFGWGATGSGRYAGSSGPTQYSGSYRFDYDKDMNATAGWTVTQTLSGNVARPLARSLSMSSGLVLSAARSSAPGGDSASRSASLQAGLGWPSYTLSLNAGLADGVAGALGNPVRGDGLFVPPAFQTHSRSVGIQATAALGRSWTALTNLQYLSISGPDAPTQSELVYLARIGYRIGQFVLSLEEVYRTSPGTSSNQVMLSFARHFTL